MKVSKELEQKMVECRDKFKEAYDLMREIETEIDNNTDYVMDAIEDNVSTRLIDQEDVNGLINDIENDNL